MRLWCWHCNRQLMYKTGKGAGQYFAQVIDQIGNIHKVHINCVKAAAVDGVKEHRGTQAD